MSWIFTLFIIIIGLVSLYYIYKFLFKSAEESKVVLTGVKKADMDTAITIPATTLPTLVEGGEYTVSFWMYVNNWAHMANKNKHILSIGSAGSTPNDFHTLLVYLGQQVNSLKIRVHAADSTTANGTMPNPEVVVSGATYTTTFANASVNGGLLESSHPLCDLPEVDLQKWVYVSIVMNGKTVDVYLDGKLARSCILPTFYRVPISGYSMRICDNKGFGGYISSVKAASYAQAPDEIWKQYMAGPNAAGSFLDYLKSFFDPSSPLNTGLTEPALS
jgi:hypothetical protein